jgi:hypothetical protein
MLNQNTFFSTTEINENFKSNSACHIIYGDSKYNYYILYIYYYIIFFNILFIIIS